MSPALRARSQLSAHRLTAGPAASALEKRRSDGIELSCIARSDRRSEFLSSATNSRVIADIAPVRSLSVASGSPTIRPRIQIRTVSRQIEKKSALLATLEAISAVASNRPRPSPSPR
jgi:hypothetical protein